MMQTVQLSIADAVYLAAVRDALARTGPWHLETVRIPDATQRCVIVMDERAFHSLLLPLPHPEVIVLIARKDPHLMAQAWEAGIVSVVSDEDPINTVLLAIMAAALRVPAVPLPATQGGISPSSASSSGPIAPSGTISSTKRCKTP